jgi:hypothetical protein
MVQGAKGTFDWAVPIFDARVCMKFYPHLMQQKCDWKQIRYRRTEIVDKHDLLKSYLTNKYC